MLRKIFLIACCAIALSGCQKQNGLGGGAPQNEIDLAEQAMTLLQSRDFGHLSAYLDPRMQTRTVDDSLARMASLIPAGDPETSEVIGWNTFVLKQLSGPTTTTDTLDMQYHYKTGWILERLVLIKSGDISLISGLWINPQPESQELLNLFTFSGKPIFSYVVFGLASIIPLFILYTLVVCIRTPLRRRKWLWIIFILFGIGDVAVNWTTGAVNLSILYAGLFGSGWIKAGYGPVIINFGVPLGAILFLSRRRRLDARNATPPALDAQESGGENVTSEE